jgi:hypothetical protein
MGEIPSLGLDLRHIAWIALVTAFRLKFGSMWTGLLCFSPKFLTAQQAAWLLQFTGQRIRSARLELGPQLLDSLMPFLT